MRVVEVAEFGGPEVLRLKELPDPEPGIGEVAIDVAVSGIQTLDGTVRRGLGGDFFPASPPYVPGMEVAGVVTSVGQGVGRAWIGRRVVAGIAEGGYATRAVTSVDKLVAVPDALGLPEAMALLHDGSTALALLEETPVQAGESVLVQPAAGGLATVLVQLLVAAGARVIGVARGERKLTLVKQLGAETVVDYSLPDWTSQVGSVDVAFDGVGGEPGRIVFEMVREGGRYSNYGNASGDISPVSPDEAAGRGITMRGIDQLPTFHADTRRRAEHILDLAAAGGIRPVIGQTFPLAEAAAAHRVMESRGFIGKALLIAQGSEG